MQYYQGYGVIGIYSFSNSFLDRMQDLSLRGSVDDSSMDEHTAMVVQHAVQVMDSHLSNIRMLLSNLPYSPKVIEGISFFSV